MIAQPKTSRLLGLALASAMLAGLTFVLAAPLLKVLKTHSRQYWIIGASGVFASFLFGFWSLGVAILMAWTLAGFETQLARDGLSRPSRYLLSLLAAATSLTICLLGLRLFFDVHLASVLKDQLLAMPAMESGVVDQLWLQIPSALICLGIVFLILGESFSHRVGQLVGLGSEAEPPKLGLFRMPDFMIWPALGSFLLAFTAPEGSLLKVFSLNLFNVMLLILFMQGLAVSWVFLNRLQVSRFFRAVLLVLMSTQLFPAVAALGLADYWIDFRNRSSDKERENQLKSDSQMESDTRSGDK